jgi:hypothetical protein
MGASNVSMPTLLVLIFEKTQRTFAFHSIEKKEIRLHPPRREITGVRPKIRLDLLVLDWI